MNIILAFILEFIKLQIKRNEEEEIHSFHSAEEKPTHNLEMRPINLIPTRAFSTSVGRKQHTLPRQNTLPPPTIKERNEAEDFNEDGYFN